MFQNLCNEEKPVQGVRAWFIFLFFYCLEAIYTKKEDFYMLFIAQYVKQLFKY